jgi:Domain of unknown function (DUF1905)
VELTFSGEVWFWRGPAPWPKDGGYIVPIKARVRKAESIEVGDDVDVQLTVPGPRASS